MLTPTALTNYNEYKNILHPWLMKSLVTDVQGKKTYSANA